MNLVFGFYDKTKNGQKRICNYTCKNYNYDYFHIKVPLKFLVKSSLHIFFTDHLKHKTVNKITCRIPSANPLQLWAHYLKSFPTFMIIFWGVQNFLIYLAKYFWSLLSSLDLFFKDFFCKNNVIKTASLVSL